MTIIIPEDYKDLEYLKKLIQKIEMSTILSPFMYMNYEDALRMTCDILLKYSLSNCIIIDLTGLTAEVFDKLLEKPFYDNPEEKLVRNLLYVNFFKKTTKTFHADNNNDRVFSVLKQRLRSYNEYNNTRRS